ncbi:glycosyltransferase family protein [Lactobacillus gasseri]|uniref:Uncharacterized protein n=1 Tax=Lactobacillus sp. JCM 1131 TaxID=3153753 RepID=A0AAU7G4U9_9LACO
MKQMNFKILGGVVTYNPEIPRFKENLKTLVNQVDKLYVFDNGSKNIEDIESVLNHYSDNIILCKKKKTLVLHMPLKVLWIMQTKIVLIGYYL